MVKSSPPKKARNFNGMNYRQTQQANTLNRTKLDREAQKLIKNQGYKNSGWDQVIQLYKKIEELAVETSLEDLFLEADRIGNKYLSDEEIHSANQKLALVLNQIEEQIDQHFPDSDVEFIDFSKKRK